ncbi:hypothetical protein D3C86_1122700 [compost metagenome]
MRTRCVVQHAVTTFSEGRRSCTTRSRVSGIDADRGHHFQRRSIDAGIVVVQVEVVSLEHFRVQVTQRHVDLTLGRIDIDTNVPGDSTTEVIDVRQLNRQLVTDHLEQECRLQGVEHLLGVGGLHRFPLAIRTLVERTSVQVAVSELVDLLQGGRLSQRSDVAGQLHLFELDTQTQELHRLLTISHLTQLDGVHFHAVTLEGLQRRWDRSVVHDVNPAVSFHDEVDRVLHGEHQAVRCDRRVARDRQLLGASLSDLYRLCQHLFLGQIDVEPRLTGRTEHLAEVSVGQVVVQVFVSLGHVGELTTGEDFVTLNRPGGQDNRRLHQEREGKTRVSQENLSIKHLLHQSHQVALKTGRLIAQLRHLVKDVTGFHFKALSSICPGVLSRSTIPSRKWRG